MDGANLHSAWNHVEPQHSCAWSAWCSWISWNRLTAWHLFNLAFMTYGQYLVDMAHMAMKDLEFLTPSETSKACDKRHRPRWRSNNLAFTSATAVKHRVCIQIQQKIGPPWGTPSIVTQVVQWMEIWEGRAWFGSKKSIWASCELDGINGTKVPDGAKAALHQMGCLKNAHKTPNVEGWNWSDLQLSDCFLSRSMTCLV